MRGRLSRPAPVGTRLTWTLSDRPCPADRWRGGGGPTATGCPSCGFQERSRNGTWSIAVMVGGPVSCASIVAPTGVTGERRRAGPGEPAASGSGQVVHRVETGRASGAEPGVDQLADSGRVPRPRPRDPPDAGVAFNDVLAIGVLRRLHEQGVAVPEEIAVTGFDDTRYTVPTLTTGPTAAGPAAAPPSPILQPGPPVPGPDIPSPFPGPPSPAFSRGRRRRTDRPWRLIRCSERQLSQPRHWSISLGWSVRW